MCKIELLQVKWKHLKMLLNYGSYFPPLHISNIHTKKCRQLSVRKWTLNYTQAGVQSGAHTHWQKTLHCTLVRSSSHTALWVERRSQLLPSGRAQCCCLWFYSYINSLINRVEAGVLRGESSRPMGWTLTQEGRGLCLHLYLRPNTRG